MKNGVLDKEFKKEAASLNQLGISTLVISADPAHQEFASGSGLNLNYELVDDPPGRFGDEERSGLMIMHGIIQGYVVPVGRGRNLSLAQATGYADDLLPNAGCHLAGIQRALLDLYNNWTDKPPSFPNGCVCDPAVMIRALDRHRKTAIGIQPITPNIEPDTSVTFCGFTVLPPLSRLRDVPMAEIFRQADNGLYRTIAYQGPQTVARRITNWPEAEIKERFVGRTPCGLCEDLVRGFPDEVNSLLKSRP